VRGAQVLRGCARDRADQQNGSGSRFAPAFSDCRPRARGAAPSGGRPSAPRASARRPGSWPRGVSLRSADHWRARPTGPRSELLKNCPLPGRWVRERCLSGYRPFPFGWGYPLRGRHGGRVSGIGHRCGQGGTCFFASRRPSSPQDSGPGSADHGDV